jgi:hypothetical protein
MFSSFTPSLNTIQGMQICMILTLVPVMAGLCIATGIMMIERLLFWATPYYNFFVYYIANTPVQCGIYASISEATHFDYLNKTLEAVRYADYMSFTYSLCVIITGFKSTLKGRHVMDINNVINRLDAIHDKIEHYHQKMILMNLKNKITEDCDVWRSANWTGLEILKMQSKCGEL